MQTTSQQERAAARQLILKRLAQEVHSTIDAFRALPPGAWDIKIYADGAAWTPREILAHQVTTEKAICALVRDVLAGGEGAPDGFDVRAFNEEQAARLAARPAEQLYAELQAARAQTIATVERMAPDDLARTGRHPWFGRAALEDVLKLIYRHNMIHVRDVQRVVRAQPRG